MINSSKFLFRHYIRILASRYILKVHLISSSVLLHQIMSLCDFSVHIRRYCYFNPLQCTTEQMENIVVFCIVMYSLLCVHKFTKGGFETHLYHMKSHAMLHVLFCTISLQNDIFNLKSTSEWFLQNNICTFMYKHVHTVTVNRSFHPFHVYNRYLISSLPKLKWFFFFSRLLKQFGLDNFSLPHLACPVATKHS